MVLLLGGLLTGWSEAAFTQRNLPNSRQQIALSFAPLVRKVAPAVVNIFTSKTVTRRQFSPLFDDPFFRRFFGEGFTTGPKRKRVQNSLGSGVIVKSDGLVVTNHHVIEGADEIRIVLADRREFKARIVGADERTDLAVLKIDVKSERLPSLAFGDSDALEVGDLVLAIGNPFGVGQTVTSGIVSALARSQVGINDLNFFIQTDAAINPGNSGGALVAMDGKLVGINSAIYSNKGGGSVGIGFAIPVNMVQTVIAGLTTRGRIIRPWLGGVSQAVGADIAASLGLRRPEGVLIKDVYRGGPADRAGIRRGDVILEVGRHGVNDAEALRYRLATKRIGGSVPMRVWRKGRKRTVSFPVEAPPERPRRNTTELGGSHPLRGARIANLSPALADEIGMDVMRRGVVVLEVGRRSPARQLGFEPGDVLVEINGEKVNSVARAKQLLARRVNRWRLAVSRGGKMMSMVVNR